MSQQAKKTSFFLTLSDRKKAREFTNANYNMITQCWHDALSKKFAPRHLAKKSSPQQVN